MMATLTDSITANLADVRRRIDAACLRADRDPAGVTLVGVTKSVAPGAVAAAIDAGLTHCGENFVQEAEGRIAALNEHAGRVSWHFIGHLQTNKAAAALELFDIIESVDSLRLAEQLSRRATDILPILLEVNVGGEASKFGFAPDEVAQSVTLISRLPNLRLEGLMTVAPAGADARPVFRQLRDLAGANGLSQLSMGMTNDFETAIEEGATIVRVGRAIFGERRS